MNIVIECIGFSHLLQLPLTLLLARPEVLGLGGAFARLETLARRVAHVMGATSIAMPTSVGLWVAAYAEQTRVVGPTRTAALLLALFWCGRLLIQLFVHGPVWPKHARTLHYVLLLIFVVQGPGLLYALLA